MVSELLQELDELELDDGPVSVSKVYSTGSAASNGPLPSTSPAATATVPKTQPKTHRHRDGGFGHTSDGKDSESMRQELLQAQQAPKFQVFLSD